MTHLSTKDSFKDTINFLAGSTKTQKLYREVITSREKNVIEHDISGGSW